jgi:hypothetical protein
MIEFGKTFHGVMNASDMWVVAVSREPQRQNNPVDIATRHV